MGNKDKKIGKDSAIPTFTEWLKIIHAPNTTSLVKEDKNRNARLEILHKKINLPFDSPDIIHYRDVIEKTKIFLDIFNKYKKESCIFKFIPNNPILPTFRSKNKVFADGIKQIKEWVARNNIPYKKYRLEITPRSSDITLSSIFIVNKQGIWGEINKGRLRGLSDGNCENTPIFFSYDFKKWQFSEQNEQIKKIMRTAIKKIYVKNKSDRIFLTDKAGSIFTKNHYIQGYFEFIVWPNKKGIRYYDYNRLLEKKINFTPPPQHSNSSALQGIIANSGSVTGIVQIINNPHDTNFQNGNILVCQMTTVDHVALIKQAKGIITERGTLLSHSALLCRELKKPYIIRVDNATKILKNGDMVFLDGSKGTIEILAKNKNKR